MPEKVKVPAVDGPAPDAGAVKVKPVGRPTAVTAVATAPQVLAAELLTKKLPPLVGNAIAT